MHRAGDQAFAGSAFASDQHRQGRVHHPRHQPIQRLHRGCAPHQRQFIVIGLHIGARGRDTALDLKRARRAFHQIGQIKGFGQIIISLGLSGLNCRHDVVLRRDDDHRQARSRGADLWQLFEPVPVWHDNI